MKETCETCDHSETDGLSIECHRLGAPESKEPNQPCSIGRWQKKGSDARTPEPQPITLNNRG